MITNTVYEKRGVCVCVWMQSMDRNTFKDNRIILHRLHEREWSYVTYFHTWYNMSSLLYLPTEPVWRRCSTPHVQRTGSSMLWTGVWTGWDKAPQQHNTGTVRLLGLLVLVMQTIAEISFSLGMWKQFFNSLNINCYSYNGWLSMSIYCIFSVKNLQPRNKNQILACFIDPLWWMQLQ